PRRSAIVNRAAPHGEKGADFFGDLAMGEAELAHHLGAAALGEFEVIGVIDNAGRVGVLVIDPQFHAVRHPRAYGGRAAHCVSSAAVSSGSWRSRSSWPGRLAGTGISRWR